MELLLQQFFNLEVMAKTFPILVNGLGMTLVLSLAVIPIGLAGGLAVALGLGMRNKPLRRTLEIVVDFFRALPPLVLLIFVHTGLPFAGLRLQPFESVCLAFFLNTSAYYGEILRAGIESIPVGQIEAARSTGLSALQAARHVVLPQAVRNVLPDLVSNTVEVVKLTALASVVALPELLYSSDMARALTYNASPLVLAALIYLVMLWPLVRLMSRLDHKLMA